MIITPNTPVLVSIPDNNAEAGAGATKHIEQHRTMGVALKNGGHLWRWPPFLDAFTYWWGRS